MRYLVVAVLLWMTACCQEPPGTYKDAYLSGCTGSGDIECCSYDGSRCYYTLCTDNCWIDWDQESWYCW